MAVRKTVEVECLLRNGREVYLSLDLERDSLAEQDGIITYTQKPEPGVVVETVVERSQVAYLRQTTRETEQEPRGYRSLGVRETVQSS